MSASAVTFLDQRTGDWIACISWTNAHGARMIERHRVVRTHGDPLRAADPATRIEAETAAATIVLSLDA